MAKIFVKRILYGIFERYNLECEMAGGAGEFFGAGVGGIRLSLEFVECTTYDYSGSCGAGLVRLGYVESARKSSRKSSL